MSKIIKRLLLVYAIFAGCMLIGSCVIGFAIRPPITLLMPKAPNPVPFYVLTAVLFAAAVAGALAVLIKAGRRYLLHSAILFGVFLPLLALIVMLAMLVCGSMANRMFFLAVVSDFFGGRSGALVGGNLLGLIAVVVNLMSVFCVFVLVLQVILSRPKLKCKKTIGTLLGAVAVVATIVLEEIVYTQLQQYLLAYQRKQYDLVVGFAVLLVSIIIYIITRRRRNVFSILSGFAERNSGTHK